MVLTIIKYNAGNIQSVLYALERIGADAMVTDDHEEIKRADKVIFPGVGEANSAMKYLREREMDRMIKGLSQPVLGICLGMQLMCRYSEENDTECMGIFDEKVNRFRGEEPKTDGHRIKVPQVGWNCIYGLKSRLFEGVEEKSYCYFVHGYYAALGEQTIATTHYIQPYSAGLHKSNFYGVQFHPEKSAGVGEKILRNFLDM